VNETLYVDSSAVVKRYRDEPGSELAVAAMDAATALATSRITFTEVARALTLHDPEGAGAPVIDRWTRDWEEHEIVELDQGVATHAAALAAHHGIRSLDALHLASALALGGTPMRFATWDRRLADAARSVGLRVVGAH
jgi:uncharacterized protein